MNSVVLDEVFKTKSPKVVVVGVTEPPGLWGHPMFKYVAPAEAIAFPPAPLLHNYFHDLAYLPARQVQRAFARFFPNLCGLRDKFDPEIQCAITRPGSLSWRESGSTWKPKSRLMFSLPNPWSRRPKPV